jgi:hypothetical protein
LLFSFLDSDTITFSFSVSFFCLFSSSPSFISRATPSCRPFSSLLPMP